MNLVIHLVQVTCDNQKLVLCYTPHHKPPYEKLTAHLQSGLSAVYLKNPNTAVVHECQIVNLDASKNYCISVDVHHPYCDLKTTFKEGQVYITGQAVVLIKRDMPNYSRNIIMDFNCSGKYDTTKNNRNSVLDEIGSFYKRPISITLNLLSGTRKTRRINNFLNISLEIAINDLMKKNYENSDDYFQKRILKAYSCTMTADVKMTTFSSVSLVTKGCPELSVPLNTKSSHSKHSKLNIEPNSFSSLLNHKTTYFFIRCSFHICNELLQNSCQNETSPFQMDGCLTSYPIHSYTYLRLDPTQNLHQSVRSITLPSESHVFTIVVLSLIMVVLMAIFTLLGCKCCTCLRKYLHGSPAYSSTDQFIKVSPDRYFNIINRD